MWLKSFQYNNKTLSDVELLVLSSIPESNYVEATTLITDLDRLLPHWNPERGTIYPLLHRLTAQNLLEKNTKGKALRFRRTEPATTFLSSLINSNGLINQFETSIQYLHLLVNAMVNVDPFATQKFVTKFEEIGTSFNASIVEYKRRIDEAIKADNWVDIDIE